MFLFWPDTPGSVEGMCTCHVDDNAVAGKPEWLKTEFAQFAKQFGVSTSTPTVDTTQTTTAPTTTTPKAKKINIPDVPPAAEGSPQADSYIEQMIEKNPEEARESIIERLRRDGIIFSPQQTVR